MSQAESDNSKNLAARQSETQNAETQHAEAQHESNPTAYLDEPESIGHWFTRLIKGIMVGIGFILPGLSGGVLAVIFKIYDPIIRFLSKPFHRFGSQIRYFIPIGIGGVIGIVLFSALVDAAFGRFMPQFVCLFIGFVLGTFPSLWKTAGEQGRNIGHWAIMIIAAIAIFALMLLGGQMSFNIEPNFFVWLLSGALIGLGVIIPGLSPSNFLIYLGLYDKMAAGLKVLDLSVAVPLFIGLIACVLLLAKAAAWLFDHFYAGMYHFILGTVIGSSLAIFPTVVFPEFDADGIAAQGIGFWPAVIFAVALFIIGAVASWLFSKLEDRVSDQRSAIEAQAK